MGRPAWLHRPADPPVGTRPRLPTAASSFGSGTTDWTDVTDAPAPAPAWSASGDVYIELAADKDVCVKDGVMYMGGAATAAGQKALGGGGGGDGASAGAAAVDAAGEKKKKAKVKDYMKTSLSSGTCSAAWQRTTSRVGRGGGSGKEGVHWGSLSLISWLFVLFLDDVLPLLMCFSYGPRAPRWLRLRLHRKNFLQGT